MASYVHLENKNTFVIIYSNLLLLNIQMCQIILPHPVCLYQCTMLFTLHINTFPVHTGVNVNNNV